MNIICNGIRKHGTHALLKAVELLGQPLQYKEQSGAVLRHDVYGDLPTSTKHLFIKRNPKNAFISLMRSYNLPLTSGMIRSKLLSFEDETYVDHCTPYLGWLDDPDTLVVKFEDLTTDSGASIDAIADHLGVSRQADAFANLFGHTVTWTGEFSDYEALAAWDAEVDAVWADMGGQALEMALDYGS